MSDRVFKRFCVCLALAVICAAFGAFALADGPAPSMYVEGTYHWQDGNAIALYSAENAAITIYSDGNATGYRLGFCHQGEQVDADDWDYYPTNTFYNRAVYENWWWNENDFPVQLQAAVTYDEFSDEDDIREIAGNLNWIACAPITVYYQTVDETHNEGTLGALRASFPLTDSVAGGTPVSINISQYDARLDHLGNIWANVHPSSGGDCVLSVSWDRINKQIVIPTWSLAAGDYDVYVHANVPGFLDCRDVHIVEAFTVTSAYNSGATSSVLGRAYVNGGINIGAYIPGADYIHVTCDFGDGDQPTQFIGGECGTVNFWRGTTGTYTYDVVGYNIVDGGDDTICGQITGVPLTVSFSDEASKPSNVSYTPAVSVNDEVFPVSFQATSGDWADVQIIYDDRDNVWIDQKHIEPLTLGTGENDINSVMFYDCFPYAGRYSVRINIGGYCMDGNGKDYTVLALDANMGDLGLLLTANGSMDNFSVESSRDVQFKVQVPEGATAIRMLCNENNWRWWDSRSFNREDDGNLYFYYNTGFSEGVYPIYAEATYDYPNSDKTNWDDYEGDDWDFDANTAMHWTERSNVIIATVTSPNGTLPEPVVSIDGLSSGVVAVNRGDVLEISITPTSNPAIGEWYWADIDVDHGDGWWEQISHNDWERRIGKIYVSTYNLEPGDYELTVYNDAYGWEGNEVRLTLRVNDAQLPTGPYFAIQDIDNDADQIDTMETFLVKAYVPGADRLMVRVTNNTQNHVDGDPEFDGDSFVWTECKEWAGSYTYALYDMSDWDWDNPDWDHPVDSITFNVVSNGALPNPSLVFDKGVFTGNENVTGSVLPSTGADVYNLNVWRRDSGWNVYDEDFVFGDNENSHAFNLGTLQPGLYDAEVWAYTEGMDAANTHVRFSVEEEIDDTKTVILKANGQTGTLNVAYRQHIDFTVAAPGASAIRLIAGEEEDYRYVDNRWIYDFDEESRHFWDWQFEEGTHIAYLQAYYGELDIDENDDVNFPDTGWTGVSAPIVINVAPGLDVLQAPTVLGLDEEIDQGEALTVRIADNATNDACGAWYWLDAWDENNERVLHANWDDRTREITLLPYDLKPGQTYTFFFFVDADGCVPKERRYAVTVLEGNVPNTPQLKMMVGGSEYNYNGNQAVATIQTLESYTIVGYVPGADGVWIDLIHNGEYWGDRNNNGVGGGVAFTDSVDWEGTCSYVMYREGDDDPVATLTFNVTAPEGDMPSPALTLDGLVLDEETPITGAIGLVQGATRYEARLRYENYDEAADMQRFGPNDFGQDGLIHFSFGTQEADVYIVEVQALAPGYNPGQSKQTLVVSPDVPTQAITLTANGQTGTLSNVMFRQDVNFRINAPGATAVRLLVGSDCQYRYLDILDPNQYWDPTDVEIGWNFESGTYTVMAQARYDELVYNEHNDPEFPSSGWFGLSNAITIQVNQKLGDLVTPEFTLNSQDNSFAQNTFLVATITNHAAQPEAAKNVMGYGLFLFDSEEACRNDWRMRETHWSPRESGVGPVMSLTDLEPGTYWIAVDNGGEGWNGARSNPVQITVTEGACEVFSVAATSGPVGYDIPYILTTDDQNVDSVKLTWMKQGWEEPDVAGFSLYDFLSYEGERRLTDHFDNWEAGTYTLTAYKGNEASDTWTQIGQQYTITLTSTGTMSAVTCHWDNLIVIDPDEDPVFRFRFDPVQDADWYSIWIADINEHGNQMFNYEQNIDWQPNTVYTITSDMLWHGCEFQPGHVYAYGVEAYKRGYARCDDYERMFFAVVESDKILNLPAALTTIEDEAFEGIDAQMIVIPASVTSIGENAFANCDNLAIILIPNENNVAYAESTFSSASVGHYYTLENSIHSVED